MPKSDKKRDSSPGSFLKKGGAAAAVAAVCALPFSVFFRERLRLESVYAELRHRKLHPDLDGLRIVHISDIHYGFYYGADELKKLADAINELRPDLLALTGDLFDKEAEPYAIECEPLMKRLAAPLGKFAVLGNHDYHNKPDRIVQLYEASGFELLRNRNKVLNVRGHRLQIAGLDDMLYGEPDLPAAFAGLDPDAFTLLLAHEPDFAERTGPYPADLQLSGHSHGGQVRLPWIGAVHTPPGGKKYVQGLYRLAGERERYVYTNRGIGTTHLPIRFLCRPELTVITLRARGRED